MMTLLALLAARAVLSQDRTVMRIHVDQPTVRVSPYLYGIFFEEINCAGDGGIYAELVRNRSFEESDKPLYWSASGSEARVIERPGGVENHHALEWNVPSPSATLANEGYWGMSVQRGQGYRLAFSAKSSPKNLTFSLETESGKTLASTKVAVDGEWKDYEATLTPNRFEPKAKLVVRADSPGTVDLDVVSLFPKTTFKGRPNGLRTDLGSMLAGLKPAFMRFPGGCWVEGDTMATAMRWKRTIGPIGERRTQPNLWQYVSGNGLGYHEYLQMCEDIGAAPLYVINCGMSHREVVPLNQMDEYVQDALDAIEYANGPTTSKWGAIRAQNGHPKSFNLKFMEIGNENGGLRYDERYKLIYNAVHAKYPEIGLVADVWGGTPKSAPVQIVDEHYYSTPQFFFENADRYDKYDRKGPKVYVGEYAVTNGCGAGNLIAAVGEAAFMCGMERNSDQVVMASYAPLFANVNYKKWNPDLINFDGSTSYGTPSYYVQKLFALNRADQVLKSELTGVTESRVEFPVGKVGLGTWNTQSEFKDLKVVKAGKTVFESKQGEGLTSTGGKWTVDGGSIRQTSNEEPSRTIGGTSFGDTYSVSVKARKNVGAEGFLLNFGVASDGDWIWWNVGGWGNSEHGIELSRDGGKEVVSRVRGRIETGRWYDLRVDVTPESIKCYLDGQFIQEAKRPSHRLVHAVAGKVDKSGDIVVKVVNGDQVARPTTILLDGVKGSVTGEVTYLTGNPKDENSIATPRKVTTKRAVVKSAASNVQIVLPPCSVSVYRLHINP